MSRHSLYTSRIRKKDAPDTTFRRQVLFGVFRLFLLVCVGALIWFGTRLSFFTIDHVVIEGGETIEHDEVRALVERELLGTYFLLIPKRFTYLYPEERIEAVLRNLDRVESATVTRTSRTAIVVSFTEYLPHALWCNDGIDADARCFFIDRNGYAFLESLLRTGGSLIRHRQEGLTEVTRGPVIDAGALAQIDTFIEKLERVHHMRSSLVIHELDGDMYVAINGGGALLITRDGNLDEMFEDLTAVLASEEFAHLEPGNFSYIDLRFRNKIFVNEELGTTTQATESLPES